MSAFRELLLQAEKKGVDRLDFGVKLGSYDETSEEQWSCVARSTKYSGLAPLIAKGRTGEEALRRVLDLIEVFPEVVI